MFALALAAVVAPTTLPVTPAAGISPAHDSPILKASTATHAAMVQAGGREHAFSAAPRVIPNIPAALRREPGVLIDPEIRRNPASLELSGSPPIVCTDSCRSTQTRPRGSLVPTPVISSLRI